MDHRLTDKLMEGQMGRWTEINGLLDRQIHGWMDGRTDWLANGCMD